MGEVGLIQNLIHSDGDRIENVCLMRIEAPWFVAGIVWERKNIVDRNDMNVLELKWTVKSCAPIVGYIARHKYSIEWAAKYFKSKGFNVSMTFYKEYETPISKRKGK